MLGILGIFFLMVLLHSPGWPENLYRVQPGLELMLLLLQAPECWDYRYVSAFLTLEGWFRYRMVG
jgi:hypothetical protein